MLKIRNFRTGKETRFDDIYAVAQWFQENIAKKKESYPHICRKVHKALKNHTLYKDYTIQYDIDVKDWFGELMYYLPNSVDYYLSQYRIILNNFQTVKRFQHYCNSTKILKLTNSSQYCEALEKMGIEINFTDNENEFIILKWNVQ